MSGAATAAPKPVQVQDVLSAETHLALLDWLLSMETRADEATIAGGVVNRSVRNALSIRAGWRPKAIDALDGRLNALFPDLAKALGVSPFDPKRIEYDIVTYNDGGFYEPHIDIATGHMAGLEHMNGWDRVITAVYYLHAEPKGYEGGALRLHAMFPEADGKRAFVDVEPVQNGLVAFPSFLLHEVRPVRCSSGAFRDSRFAINAWFQRPRA